MIRPEERRFPHVLAGAVEQMPSEKGLPSTSKATGSWNATAAELTEVWTGVYQERVPRPARPAGPTAQSPAVI